VQIEFLILFGGIGANGGGGGGGGGDIITTFTGTEGVGVAYTFRLTFTSFPNMMLLLMRLFLYWL